MKVMPKMIKEARGRPKLAATRGRAMRPAPIAVPATRKDAFNILIIIKLIC